MPRRACMFSGCSLWCLIDRGSHRRVRVGVLVICFLSILYQELHFVSLMRWDFGKGAAHLDAIEVSVRRGDPKVLLVG